MASIFTKIAGVSGALAVGIGAYGAHGFKPKDPKYKEVFDTASKYHFFHSLALLGVGAAGGSVSRPNVTGGLIAAGTLAFCGSCYAVAIKEDRSVGRLAPVGGMALIAGWLSMAL